MAITLRNTLILVVLMVISITAQEQHIISYQGNIRGSGGTPLDGTYSMHFRIYNAPGGGTMLWSETQSVLITDGYFSVQLGSVTPLTPEIYAPENNEFRNMYLEIEINGETIYPRTRIGYTPWSATSERLRGDVITNPGQLFVAEGDPGLPVIELNSLQDGGSVIIRETEASIASVVLNPAELFMALPVPTPKSFRMAVDAGAHYRADLLALVDTTGDTIMVATTKDNSGSISLFNTETQVGGSFLNPIGLRVTLPTPIPKSRVWSEDVGGHYRGDMMALVDTTGDTIMAATTTNNSARLALHNTEMSGVTSILNPSSLIFTLPTPIPKSDHGRGTMYTSYRADGMSIVDTLGDTLMRVASDGTLLTQYLLTGGFLMPTGAVEGHVLTSDVFGIASWQPPSGGGSSGWTDDGSVVILENTSDDVSIGAADPEAKLYAYSSDDFYVTKSVYGGVGTSDARAVYGESNAVDFYGVGGEFKGGYIGVMSSVTPTGSNIYYGIQTYVNGGSGTNYGIYSEVGGTGTNYAGFFEGDVYVNGNLINKKSGFTIDHPLDPENKDLKHATVNSSEMKNIYDGVVILDENGEASVTLSDYFQALNKDYRYQLTCIGGYAQVYIAEEIANNSFKIAGGNPGMKISWQVTGIRNDAFASVEKFQVVTEKIPLARGK